MTPDLDPDRRRPPPTPPPHPGFVQKPLDIDIDMCVLCKTLVLATDIARIEHVQRDQKISQLLQLSGAGSRAFSSATTAAEPSPAPAQDAPTPPPGQHRGGVEGANQGKRPAGIIPPADGALPSVDRGDGPPSPRSTERSRPGGQHPGRGVAIPGRELTVDEADQARYDAWLAGGGRS